MPHHGHVTVFLRDLNVYRANELGRCASADKYWSTVGTIDVGFPANAIATWLWRGQCEASTQISFLKITGLVVLWVFQINLDPRQEYLLAVNIFRVDSARGILMCQAPHCHCEVASHQV